MGAHSQYDNMVDFWNLGMAFYQLVHGDTPFEDKEDDDTVYYNAVLNGSSSFKTSTNCAFDDVILNLLKIEPRERFGTY